MKIIGAMIAIITCVVSFVLIKNIIGETDTSGWINLWQWDLIKMTIPILVLVAAIFAVYMGIRK